MKQRVLLVRTFSLLYNRSDFGWFLIIDHETDQLIQETLRTQVGKDVSVLIVAHRLKTIIDTDKIVRMKWHVSLITDDRR
jgi:ABC-type transport system involved in Fe-S cluster assembly fused permease/ATPase subunit